MMVIYQKNHFMPHQQKEIQDKSAYMISCNLAKILKASDRI